MTVAQLVAFIALPVAGGLGVSGKVDARASWACVLAGGLVVVISWLVGAR